MIVISDGDPQAPPLIECQLFEQEADVDTLARGVEATRDIMRADPIAHLLEEESEPGLQVIGVSELNEYMRTHTVIADHSLFDVTQNGS